MTPGAHFLISWLGSVELLQARRERVVVTLSGVAPDIDGLGIVVDKITGHTDYFFTFHHYLGHSALSALVIATLASVVASAQRKLVWVLSFVLVHLRILCDVVGSKGPDGYQWPVYYLYPFDSKYALTWQYQWELNAWPNQLLMVLLLGASLYYVAKKRITFFEVISRRLNDEAVNMYDKYIRKVGDI